MSNKKALCKIITTKLLESCERHGLIHLSETNKKIVEVLSAHIEITWELVENGAKVNPHTLALILFKKGLGFARLSASEKHQCGIAIATFGVTSALAYGEEEATGGLETVNTVAGVMEAAYDVGNACQVSETDVEKIKRHMHLDYRRLFDELRGLMHRR
jgi:hypothetical protein